VIGHQLLELIAGVLAATVGMMQQRIGFTPSPDGLALGAALNRCHALDDQGLYWFEEPIAYDNLSGYGQLTHELETPVQLGENFYPWPFRHFTSISM
jgi:mandelate racemase